MEIVIRRIVDHVEDDFLNICVDDLLDEYSNFAWINVSSISIRSMELVSNYSHVKQWNVTLITHPCHNSNGQAGARLWNAISHPCLYFNRLVRTWVLIVYYMQCILELCWSFWVSMFWFVDVSVCWRFGLSTFRSVNVSVCRRFGLSTFWFVDVSVCRRFGLSMFLLSTFRFVDVLVVDVSVCRRFGCRRFGLSTFWLAIYGKRERWTHKENTRIYQNKYQNCIKFSHIAYFALHWEIVYDIWLHITTQVFAMVFAFRQLNLIPGFPCPHSVYIAFTVSNLNMRTNIYIYCHYSQYSQQFACEWDVFITW